MPDFYKVEETIAFSHYYGADSVRRIKGSAKFTS